MDSLQSVIKLLINKSSTISILPVKIVSNIFKAVDGLFGSFFHLIKKSTTGERGTVIIWKCSFIAPGYLKFPRVRIDSKTIGNCFDGVENNFITRRGATPRSLVVVSVVFTEVNTSGSLGSMNRGMSTQRLYWSTAMSIFISAFPLFRRWIWILLFQYQSCDLQINS